MNGNWKDQRRRHWPSTQKRVGRGGINLLSKTSSDNLVVTERISVHNASPPTHQATQQAQTALMIFFWLSENCRNVKITECWVTTDASAADANPESWSWEMRGSPTHWKCFRIPDITTSAANYSVQHSAMSHVQANHVILVWTVKMVSPLD